MSEPVTSETQPPTSAHGYVDHWERGLDPWHADAFVGTPAEGRFEHTGARSTGWSAIDWVGNEIGFVPDGTPIAEKGNDHV
jgi:hypothetical protein